MIICLREKPKQDLCSEKTGACAELLGILNCVMCMREDIDNNNQLFGFVTIWIKESFIKDVSKNKRKYNGGGGGETKCKNPQVYHRQI